jgi:hypothetical protein
MRETNNVMRGISKNRRPMGRRAFFSVFLLGIFGVCGFAPVGAQQNGPSQESPMTLEGDWSGLLRVGATSLRIVFHVTAAGTQYSATMDSPDQGARGIPVSAVRIDGRNVAFEVAAIGGKYSGTLNETGALEGTWKQSGQSLPLNLERQSAQTPQKPAAASGEPSPPFPYIVKNVEFSDEKAGIQLAGTLTYPKGKGPFPGVVLVSGSGLQNRDEEILGHKPFLVLADYLTRRGIAVLRYDDRGAGGSKGSFQSATTFDFADDAQAAVDFLARQTGIDAHHIGVIGHSEGAIVASILAARGAEDTQDAKVAFIVLLGGPGVRGDELLLMQNAALGRASGLSESQIAQANKINRELYSIAMSEGDVSTLRKKIVDTMNGVIESTPSLTAQQKEAQKAQVEAQADQLLSPWIRTFLSLDPSEYLRRVQVPVLALDGSKDLQVPAKENLAAISAALNAAGNHSATMTELEGLNHLFQHANSGLPSEYGEIEETFAPEALKQIGDWILSVGAR